MHGWQYKGTPRTLKTLKRNLQTNYGRNLAGNAKVYPENYLGEIPWRSIQKFRKTPGKTVGKFTRKTIRRNPRRSFEDFFMVSKGVIREPVEEIPGSALWKPR